MSFLSPERPSWHPNSDPKGREKPPPDKQKPASRTGVLQNLFPTIARNDFLWSSLFYSSFLIKIKSLADESDFYHLIIRNDLLEIMEGKFREVRAKFIPCIDYFH